MLLVEKNMRPQNVPGSMVGIWWYDPKEKLVFSFPEDITNRRIVRGNLMSTFLHTDFWPAVQRAVPEYAGLRDTQVPRGRVGLSDGKFTVLCPPSLVNDASMRNEIMVDFQLDKDSTEFVGNSHYDLVVPTSHF